MTTPVEVKYETVALVNEGERETYVKQFKEKQAQSAFIYQVKGRPVFAYGEIYVGPNQNIIADNQALLWMDNGLNVDADCVGGCYTSCCRSLSGEGFCLNIYRGTDVNQKLTVGFELPGDMMAFGITPGNGWVLSYDAFVAGTDNLRVSCKASSCLACLCADTPLCMTHVSVDQGDSGIFLGGGYGMIERHDIMEGQTFVISKGLFFAAHENTIFEVGLIGGLTNCICTGGGIVLRFRGPCCVYTLSRNSNQLLRDFGLPSKGPVRRNRQIHGGLIFKVLKAILENSGRHR